MVSRPIITRHAERTARQQYEEFLILQEEKLRREEQEHSQSLYQEEEQEPPVRVTSDDESQDIPLLLEAIEKRQFDIALERLREFPQEAGMTMLRTNNPSNLALHEACKHQPPLELVDALIGVNPGALCTKGQWGYLPLHFACCSRASPSVVARLIVKYPSATRTKDDHDGRLPLHLAAKWGADDQIIMALLTVYPKASTIRDTSGRTPMDHARSIPSSSIREAVLTALDRASILIAVSKAAMNKLAFESDYKLREIAQGYQDKMLTIKEKYDEDKKHAVALEVQLRKELWDEKERSNSLEKQVAKLQKQLEGRKKDVKEKDKLLQQISGLMKGEKSTATHSKPARKAARTQSIRQKNEITSEKPPTIDKSNEAKETPLSPREGLEDTRKWKEEQKQLARLALREWMPGDTRATQEEQRDPPPPGPSTGAPSPRSAAVAAAKEWLSNAHEAEDSSVEQYAHRFHKGLKSSSSLLNRSKSTPLSKAVLARHEVSRSSSSESRRTKTPTPTSSTRSGTAIRQKYVRPPQIITRRYSSSISSHKYTTRSTTGTSLDSRTSSTQAATPKVSNSSSTSKTSLARNRRRRRRDHCGTDST